MLGAVHVLVTGFEPFGGFAYNPSEAAVHALPNRLDDLPVRRAVLPVDTSAVASALRPLWSAHPRVVVHTGLAETRRHLSIERTAVNQRSFERPDNAGRLTRDAEVVSGGPPRLSGRIDPAAVEEAWKMGGVPGGVSDSAGEFLCNQVFYLSLHHLPETTGVGFVHLPPDETFAPRAPHVTLDEQVRAIVLVVQTAVQALRRRVGEETRA